MMLGRVDEVEVEEELRDAEHQGEDMTLTADPQRRSGPARISEHRGAGDREAVGDRPGPGHRAELIANDQPGRAPDEGDQDERDKDPRLEESPVHSAAMAAASRSTAWTSEFQLVTS